MTHRIRPKTQSPAWRELDKLSASMWPTLIKPIDPRNITVASGSSKLRGSVNKAENISQTLRPDVRATNKRGSIIWSQEGPVFCMWKYQITITFTRILEAWVALFEQEQHIMVWGIDAVCLFCGQFAELMGFTVQNEREWNGAIWCLSRLCDSVGDSAQSKRATMWRVKVNNHGEFH